MKKYTGNEKYSNLPPPLSLSHNTFQIYSVLVFKKNHEQIKTSDSIVKQTEESKKVKFA